MDATLEKKVAEYKAKIATVSDLARVDNIKPGHLARYAIDGRACYIKCRPGCYDQITEGQEVIAHTNEHKKTFALGTPPDEVRKYFEDIKLSQIRDMMDLLGEDAEVVIPIRQKLEIVEKDGRIEAKENFGVLGLGR